MDQAEVHKLVEDLEIAVDRVRSLYEQYFMGIEKLEPTIARKDIERRVQVLRKEQLRNTAMRFRFQMVIQRFNTYQTHWQRICREIDNGTYKRHVMRARRRFAEEDAPTSSGSKPSMPAPASTRTVAALTFADADEPEAVTDLRLEILVDDPPSSSASLSRPSSGPASAWRRAVPTPPRTLAPPSESLDRSAGVSPSLPPSLVPPSQKTPVSERGSEISDDRVRQIYAQFVETKRRRNESTAGVTYDAIANTLRESSAKLKQKFGRAVDFEVSEKDGKTVIKPTVRK